MTGSGVDRSSSVAAAVTAIHREQCDAMVAADTDALHDLLASGYTLTHMTGYVQDKAEWLDEVDRGSMTYGPHGFRGRIHQRLAAWCSQRRRDADGTCGRKR